MYGNIFEEEKISFRYETDERGKITKAELYNLNTGIPVYSVEPFTVIYIDKYGKLIVVNDNKTYLYSELTDTSGLDEAIAECSKYPL